MGEDMPPDGLSLVVATKEIDHLQVAKGPENTENDEARKRLRIAAGL